MKTLELPPQYNAESVWIWNTIFIGSWNACSFFSIIDVFYTFERACAHDPILLLLFWNNGWWCSITACSSSKSFSSLIADDLGWLRVALIFCMQLRKRENETLL